MNSFNKRVVTYLSEKYKKSLQQLCDDREEKEALIVREIIKEYFDLQEKYKIKPNNT